MFNLLVDLDERFSAEAAHALHAIFTSNGFDTFLRKGADGRTLAWIDATFGGTWSNEAFNGSNVIVSRDGVPVGFATIDNTSARFSWLRGEAAQPGTGIFGPFGVDLQHRSVRQGQGDTAGSLILKLAMCELRARGYSRALIAAVGNERLIEYYSRVVGAAIAEEFEPLPAGEKPRTVILASGSGTNAQAVIDAVKGGLPLTIEAIVTNRAGAKVIERAERANIPCDVVVWNRAEDSREQYDELLLQAVRAHEPDLVLLLGWMHLLSSPFVSRFPNLLNIHPAFLPHDQRRDEVDVPDGTTIPAFRGAYAVRDALAAKSAWVGASFHTVTMETDRGEVLARRPLAVEPNEDADALLGRLHPVEHEVVVAGIKRWLYEYR